MNDKEYIKYLEQTIQQWKDIAGKYESMPKESNQRFTELFTLTIPTKKKK